MTKHAAFFLAPKNSVHRQYEALRARYVEELPLAEVAERFEYSYGTVRNLCAEFQSNPEQPFFLSARQRRKKAQPQAPEPAAEARALARQGRDQRIVALRKQENLSITEIAAILSQQGVPVSGVTVMRVLRAAGIGKLHRRGLQERLDNMRPEQAAVANYRQLDLSPRRFHTDFGGLFLFAHDLARVHFDTLLERSGMPGSSMIPAGCAVRALLALKLWGLRRSAHVMAEALDPGLALFAGLNIMPKRSTLTEYSCRVHPDHCRSLMEGWHEATHGLGIPLGGGTSFDLDFHTIPYHGKDTLVEKHYISKRSRSQMGILSMVARDAQARHFVYVDAQIRKKKRNEQILSFVDFWRERTGAVPQELVFDSTFTTYANLARLQERGIAFLTLRRRSRKMLQELAAKPKEQWRQIRLTNVGRTFRTPRILEQKVRLRGYNGHLRQMAIKDLGHDKPTLLLTNQWTTPAAQLVDRYARRMVIENTLADAIDFFHMDALSSAVPMNIDVDLQLTLMASTLYRLQATRIGHGMESAKPRTLFRKFVRAGADITIEADRIIVQLPRRTNNPYLRAAGYHNAAEPIPWLGNLPLHIRLA